MVLEMLLRQIDAFLAAEPAAGAAEAFCNRYMDLFYDGSQLLDQEVDAQTYDLLDDVNLLCDSYEDNDAVRASDPWCIGEAALREKLTALREKLRERAQGNPA